jgi:hypothetical protein
MNTLRGLKPPMNKTPLENPVCVLYKLDCETVSHLMRPMNEVHHFDGIGANGSAPVTHLMILAGSMLAARRAGNSAASNVATNETALTEIKSLARIRVGRAVIKYNPPGISSGRNLK